MRSRKVGEPLPRLSVAVYGRVTFDKYEHAKEIVDYLLAHPNFAPSRFGEYEPFKRITASNLEQAIELIVNQTGQKLDPDRIWSMVHFEQTSYPQFSGVVSWSKLPHSAFSRSFYSIEDSFVRKAKQLDKWLYFVQGLLGLHKAWYMSCALSEEGLKKNFLEWRSQHPRAKDPTRGVGGASGVGLKLEQGIPGVYWGNYFGPFYVDWFGREKFETLPCTKKQWLETGGVFFTTAPTPFDWDTPEARQTQQAVKEHLGIETFFDMETVRRQVQELEPIPENMRPEHFQSPRHVPEFPFEITQPRRSSVAEEMKEAKRYFTEQGFMLVDQEGERTLIFHDDKEDVIRVTVGHHGSVEYLPKSD